MEPEEIEGPSPGNEIVLQDDLTTESNTDAPQVQEDPEIQGQENEGSSSLLSRNDNETNSVTDNLSTESVGQNDNGSTSITEDAQNKDVVMESVENSHTEGSEAIDAHVKTNGPLNTSNDMASDREQTPDGDVVDAQGDGVQELGSQEDLVEENKVSPSTFALQDAIHDLNVSKTEVAIKDGADVQYTRRENKYKTFIHELVISYSVLPDWDKMGESDECFTKILVLLLNNGIGINSTDLNNKTPSHYAASYPDNGQIVKILSASGATVNDVDVCRETPLHKAILKSDIDVINTILECGGSPNLFNNVGHTALHLAAKRKHGAKIVRLLIEKGAQVNLCKKISKHVNGPSALHLAAKFGQIASMQELLLADAKLDSVDQSGQQPIHLAAAHDVTGKCLMLLHRKGVNLNEQDLMLLETPLHKACKAQMIENFKYLMQMRADPNRKDANQENVLHKAALCQQPLIWARLLEANGNFLSHNLHGNSPKDLVLKARNNMALSFIKPYEERYEERKSISLKHLDKSQIVKQ